MFLRSLTLACLMAAPGALAADPALVDLLPPGATFVLGINVRNLVDSPLAKTFSAEARRASAQIGELTALTGFDPFRDVDAVLIAGVGQGKNAPGLMIARGRFGSARAKSIGTPYHGVPISGKLKSATAFLDDSTAVIGDTPMVRAAIDRRGKGGASELRDKAAELAARYDLFGFGTVPAGAVPESGPGNAMKGVDQFQFGMVLGRDLELAGELRARTAEDAQKLSQAVQLVSLMMAGQPGAGDLAKNLDLKMDGNTLRLSLVVPEAELMKAMNTRMAANRKPPSARPAVAATAPQPELKAEPRRDPRFSKDTVLVITGSESDGGTIVITDPAKR